MEASRVERIPVRLLRPADSPRSTGPDPARVRLLVETWARLPPVLVHRPTMRVIDGMHRLTAALWRGDQTIEAQFFEGSESDAFVLSVEVNLARGTALSPAERQAAAARIVVSHPDWSDRAIAVTAGLSAGAVAAIRARSVGAPAGDGVRVGRDGRVRPVNAADGRRRAYELIKARPTASLREIAKAAGIAVGTARDVRIRVQRGEDPLPARLRSATRDEGASAPAADGSAHDHVPDVDHRDLVTAVERLAKDPSLRFTDRGRELLRWLRATTAFLRQFDGMADTVPHHHKQVVADLARGWADAWRSFAEELERSGGDVPLRGAGA